MHESVHWWKKVPFFRLLVWLATGIILQWYVAFEPWVFLILCISGSACTLVYSLLPLGTKFSYAPISGIFIAFQLSGMGMGLVWWKDILQKENRIDNVNPPLIVRLEEPVSEKTNSFKSLASVQYSVRENGAVPASGNLILYFNKGIPDTPQYGALLQISKQPESIRNSGNPNCFEYKRYARFNGITHQVYLTEKDFVILPERKINDFYQFILNTRLWVLGILRTHIRGEKEAGLAEALLIGYKDDLDKNLLQAYSNTGVVHVIAISGLHLGLIYAILVLLTKPLEKRGNCLRLLAILISLWIFSILAGAQPSILRSAVMFSFIALGNSLQKKASVYNSLALSAFILLCYQPFWLWDAGFQLSYAAVLSIILFYQPIRNWFYFQNRLIDGIWQLAAATLSAQLLTLPVCLYHFHQFPALFLLTNLVAVPLSGIILTGEIILCALSPFPELSSNLGELLSLLINWMNRYIERMDQTSIARISNMDVPFISAVLLSIMIPVFCLWMLNRCILMQRAFLFFLLVFVLLHHYYNWHAGNQQKMIVYNIPKKDAIDLFEGRNCISLADADLQEGPEYNLHIAPNRIASRIREIESTADAYFSFHGKKICYTGNALPSDLKGKKVDYLIVSGKTKRKPEEWLDIAGLQQIIISGSVTKYKTSAWKKLCRERRIPCHVVTEDGAFVLNFSGE